MLFTTGFPSRYYGLVTSTGKYYGAVNTAIGTGQIISIPNDLEFAPLLSKGVSLDTLLYADGNTDGVWEAGIACANSSGAVTDYWNTEVTFTASGTDPNGFVWSDTPGTMHHQRHGGLQLGCRRHLQPACRQRLHCIGVRMPGPHHHPDHRHPPQRRHLLIHRSAHRQPDPERILPPHLVGGDRGGDSGHPELHAHRADHLPVRADHRHGNRRQRPGNRQLQGPSNDGGSSIISYKVTATDATNSSGTKSTTGSASPITISGLTNGDNYTLTVAATNSVGTGPASGASNAVVPATVPDAPVIGTATGLNGHASVAFSPPDTNGGSAI